MIKQRLNILFFLFFLLILVVLILVPGKLYLKNPTGFVIGGGGGGEYRKALGYLVSNDSKEGFFEFTPEEEINFEDGTYFLFDNISSSNFQKYLKIEVTANATDLVGDKALLGKYDITNSNFFELHFGGDGKISFLTGDMDYGTTIQSVNKFDDGLFHNIVIIITKNEGFMFVDGNLETQTNYIGRIKDFSNTGNLIIGASAGGFDNFRRPYSYFVGNIESVNIYYN